MMRILYCDHRGSALVICLMVLAILTLLGTTAIMNTGTETKITHSARKSEEAFYAAEAGIEHILSYAEPEDLAAQQEIESDTDQYGPQYKVTILDVVDMMYVTVYNIESIGYAGKGQTRRVLRSSIQKVKNDVGESTTPVGAYRTYPDEEE
jgi:Tfp pilus assembly protein PilX